MAGKAIEWVYWVNYLWNLSYDDANTCLLLYCERDVEVHLLARAHKYGEVTGLDDPILARGKRRRRRSVSVQKTRDGQRLASESTQRADSTSRGWSPSPIVPHYKSQAAESASR